MSAEEQNSVMDYSVCLVGDESKQTNTLEEFINTEDYSKRLEIFHTLTSESASTIEKAICLLNNQEKLASKQVLYFLDDMKNANDISDEDYIAVLSHLIKKPNFTTLNKPLMDFIFSKLSFYVSQDEDKLYIEELLTDANLPVVFQIFFLKEHLKQNICKPSVVVSIVSALKNQGLDLYRRSEILDISSRVCKENEEFKQAMSLLSFEPELEWALKEKALIYYQTKSVTCSKRVVDHLLENFSRDINWHIREAIVDVLSESGKDCAQKVISFFSEFVMQNSEDLAIDLVDFRQSKIQLILWSIVYLGMKHDHLSATAELKKMAMKYDMNVYFRVRAVEALKDLSLYFEVSAEALYEIVRDNKRVVQSDFITYDQMIRDTNDKKVRDQAFIALVELLKEKPEDFFSFLKEKSDFEQIYRRKAFIDQTLPLRLDVYARPALIKLMQDTKVEQEYRDHALFILE